MIARSWHGAVPADQGEPFYKHLLKTGVAEAKATKGNVGIHLHHENQGLYTHFFLITYWADFEAVRRFAGPEPQRAVNYPEDERYGLISDPIVLHHEVLCVPERFL